VDPAGFHLAQLNIARPKAPMDSGFMDTFNALLDPVNAVADSTPGFVWRLQTDAGNATSLTIYGEENLLVNMSVWESADALWDFVYSGDHLAVMRRRREWFNRMAELFTCLWWVEAGRLPDIPEAEEKLSHLRDHGPTEQAFTFKERFPAPDAEPSRTT